MLVKNLTLTPGLAEGEGRGKGTSAGVCFKFRRPELCAGYQAQQVAHLKVLTERRSMARCDV